MARELTFEERVADPIGAAIGSFGLWHVWICFLTFLTKFPVGFHPLSTIFLAHPTDFECAVPGNQTDKCSDKCKEVKFDRSTFHETIITEWDLICDRSYLADLSQTIFMFGILVGNIAFGVWSDKGGRRPPLVFSLLLSLVAGVATSFMPLFELFCLFRFLLGVAIGGCMLISFVLLMEVTDSKNREVMGILFQIPFNMGHSMIPAFAYFFRDWRHFQFAISVTSVAYIPYYCILPESPRWLLAAGRIDESAKILENAAKINKRSTATIRGDLEEAARRKNLHQSVAQGTLVDLFRHPNLRSKTIYMSYNWFVCGLTYYGVGQYIGELSGDIFLNVALAGCLGIPGTVLCIFTGRYFGRKCSLIFSNTLAGICMLLIAFEPQVDGFVKVILASLGILGMAMSFGIVYIYAGELFPTVVRNAAIGFASMMARIGAMIAPFVIHTTGISESMPPFIFGVVTLIGSFLAFLLPETLGAHLPETIEEGEAFGK